jgi:NADPH:quinone reductase-like Zn-dependent oxidoreductase
MTTTTPQPTMKAVRIHSYGDSSVLVYEDAPRPEPGPGQVLVAVRAAGVQPVDREIRAGEHPEWGYSFPITLGTDLAGVVAAVGEGVDRPRVGQEVWGQGDITLGGSYAEYCLVPAWTVAAKPEKLDWAAAAAPVAASTARQTLVDVGGLDAGQTVLVLAAGGAVGSYAVQLARAMGAGRVLATCASKECDEVRRLGADRVLPYDLPTPFEEVFRGVHLACDFVGAASGSWGKALQTLAPAGIVVETNYFPTDEDKAAAREQGKRTAFVAGVATTGTLDEVARLFDEGALRPQVGAVLPLSEAGRAHEWGESRDHPRGHFVLQPDGGATA